MIILLSLVTEMFYLVQANGVTNSNIGNSLVLLARLIDRGLEREKKNEKIFIIFIIYYSSILFGYFLFR